MKSRQLKSAIAQGSVAPAALFGRTRSAHADFVSNVMSLTQKLSFQGSPTFATLGTELWTAAVRTKHRS
jgi:hypothetical protein